MLPPNIWGKHIWNAMHIIALSFPENPTAQDRKQYEIFFITIGKVLPCCLCRSNYEQHLKEIPVNFFITDNKTLFAWTVEMHNIVNKSKGKREWGLEEAMKYYSNAEFEKCKSIVISNDLYFKIFIGVLIAIIFLLVIMYAKK